MADEAGELEPHEPDPFTDHLPWWVRLVLAALGAGGAVFGVWAIFRSDNQAGTAVLLVVAAAFLLIGLQGTALRRFSGSEVELANYRRRVATAVRDVVRNESPEVALAVSEALQSIDPSVSLVAMPWQIYEHQVAQALHQVTPVNFVNLTYDRGTDFRITGPSGTEIDVVVKYRRQGFFTHVDLIKSEARVGDGPRATPLLIITNVKVGMSASVRLARTVGSVAVTTWSLSDGVKAMSDAIAELENDFLKRQQGA